MQSDRVLTNFWAGNFPLALESRERDSGDNGVSAYFGGGGGGLTRSDERDRGRRVERFRINASGRACNSI